MMETGFKPRKYGFQALVIFNIIVYFLVTASGDMFKDAIN
jgi:hypothetical protein